MYKIQTFKNERQQQQQQQETSCREKKNELNTRKTQNNHPQTNNKQCNSPNRLNGWLKCI